MLEPKQPVDSGQKADPILVEVELSKGIKTMDRRNKSVTEGK